MLAAATYGAVECRYVAFDGTRYGMRTTIFDIPIFEDEQLISKLPLQPLGYHNVFAIRRLTTTGACRWGKRNVARLKKPCESSEIRNQRRSTINETAHPEPQICVSGKEPGGGNLLGSERKAHTECCGEHLFVVLVQYFRHDACTTSCKHRGRGTFR